MAPKRKLFRFIGLRSKAKVKIRTTAVMTATPIMTTLSGAKAAAMGIAALKKSGYAVRTIQEYH